MIALCAAARFVKTLLGPRVKITKGNGAGFEKNDLLLFLENSRKKPNSILELENSILDTLNNSNFINEASKPASKWIDIDINIVKNIIIEFIGLL